MNTFAEPTINSADDGEESCRVLYAVPSPVAIKFIIFQFAIPLSLVAVFADAELKERQSGKRHDFIKIQMLHRERTVSLHRARLKVSFKFAIT